MKRRNTPAKNTILSIMQSANKAVSQEDIENEVKGTMDRVTIYRVLNSFCTDGLVHKVLADDGKTYFALCQNCEEHQHTHNHFHFRCMKCGNLECLKEEIAVKIPAGYKLENVNCLLAGFCRDCA